MNSSSESYSSEEEKLKQKNNENELLEYSGDGKEELAVINLDENVGDPVESFVAKDAEQSRYYHDHRKPLGSKEDHDTVLGGMSKSVLYGGLDGIITPFAIVAGVAGSGVPAGVSIVLGVSKLIADGLSMAIGDYFGTQADVRFTCAERQREVWEIGRAHI